MNYVLQVVRGRSTSTTLKLAEGVTSIGRSDGCWIRIKSSQVSRKHCELFESGDKLSIRDLGSANGTWVNGKRVDGQQVLNAGDELTIGGVSFRVASPGAAAASVRPRKSGDTAVVDAVPVSDDEDEEFELEFEAEEVSPVEVEMIPLADEAPTSVVPKTKPPSAQAPAKAAGEKKAPEPAKEKKEGEDEAIAQFLLDLKLEDDE
jgi:pSer/pThr/pTyr-binding forkhead associated (FHA) protein